MVIKKVRGKLSILHCILYENTFHYISLKWNERCELQKNERREHILNNVTLTFMASELLDATQKYMQNL